MKKNIIPSRIFIWEFISSGDELTRLTLNIIIGILKIIIIKLPMAKFLLFNKYIDPEIEAIQVIIGDPIKKLIKIIFKLEISILSKRQAIGIIIKKGNWRNSQIIIIFIKTIIS